jgi:hypothetical protein
MSSQSSHRRGHRNRKGNTTYGFSINNLLRTIASNKERSAKGFTAVDYYAPSIENETSADMNVYGDAIISASPDNNQTDLHSLDALPSTLHRFIYASNAIINNGIPDATGVYSNPGTLVVDPNDYELGLVDHAPEFSMVKANSEIKAPDFEIKAGSVTGVRTMRLGKFANLAGYLSQFPELLALIQYMYTGTSVTNGLVDAQTSITNAVNPTGGDTADFGFGDPGAATPLENVLLFLVLFTLIPTVTVRAVHNDSCHDPCECQPHCCDPCHNKDWCEPPQAPSAMRFWIEVGTQWFGNDVLYDRRTGKPINIYPDGETSCDCSCDGLPNMNDYVDVNSPYKEFIKRFPVDFSKQYLAADMALTSSPNYGTDVMSIQPHTPITNTIHIGATLNTEPGPDMSRAALNFASAVNAGDVMLYLPTGPGTGLVTQLLENELGNLQNYFVNDGSDRSFFPFAIEVQLSRGHTSRKSVSITDMTILPGGIKIHKKTKQTAGAASFTPLSTGTRNVSHFFHAVADEGFDLVADAATVGIISGPTTSSIPAGAMTTGPQELLDSSRWNNAASFSLLNIGQDGTLPTHLRMTDTLDVSSQMALAPGSTVSGRSKLGPGTKTSGGMMADDDVSFTVGSDVEDAVRIPYRVSIPASAGQNSLAAGTTIPAKTKHGSTTLPVGMNIPNGNTLPAQATINPSQGITLVGPSDINNAEFAANFVLEGVGLGQAFTAGSGDTLSANVTLTPGTNVARNSTWPFPFPLQPCHELKKGTSLPVGMNFSQGTELPAILMEPQALGNALRIGTGQAELVPYLIVVYNNQKWAVYPVRTLFRRDFVFPIGSVFLAANEFTTTDLGTSAVVVDILGHTVFGSAVGTPNNWTQVIGGLGTTYLEYQTFAGHRHTHRDQRIFPFDMPQGIPTLELFVSDGVTPIPSAMAVPFTDRAENLPSFRSSADFIISREVPLQRDYCVDEYAPTYWPANRAMPFSFEMKSSFPLPADSVLKSEVMFPSCETAPAFDYSPLSVEGSSITFGGSSGSAHGNFQIPADSTLPIDQAAITLGYGTDVSFINNLGDPGYTLPTPMLLHHDWSIRVAITEYPAFTIAGINLNGPGTLPGNFTVNARDAIPSGLTTASSMTLARDVTVGADNDLVVPSGSTLARNTMLAADTSFPDGAQLQNVTLGALPTGVPKSFRAFIPGNVQLPPMLYDKFADNDLPGYVIDHHSDIQTILQAIAALH